MLVLGGNEFHTRDRKVPTTLKGLHIYVMVNLFRMYLLLI